MKESVSFKVYLKNLGSEDQAEIRLFVIDKDVCTSFAYLQKKLATIFPGLQEEIFTINWTDEDGDIVTIATDEELTIALSRMKGPVYKIRVCVKGGNKNEDKSNKSDMNGEVHSNMTCDGCGKSIEGYGYKCVYFDRHICSSCIAFDDTSKCHYGTVDRPFHCMVKFPRHMGNFGGAGFWKTDNKIHAPKFGGGYGAMDHKIHGPRFEGAGWCSGLQDFGKTDNSIHGPRLRGASWGLGGFCEKENMINVSGFGGFGVTDNKIHGPKFGECLGASDNKNCGQMLREWCNKISRSRLGESTLWFGSFGEKDSKIHGSTLGGASCGLGDFGETDKNIHGPEFGGAF